MRKRTVRMTLATLGGALLGGVAVFLLLAGMGKRAAVSPSPSPPASAVPTAMHEQADDNADASPSATPDGGRVSFDDLGISLVLPDRYRVAETLNALDRSRSGLPPKVTVTQADEEREKEYVRLLESLQASAAGTEAPEFFPGRTMSVSLVRGPTDEEFSARLAKERTAVETRSGLSGPRYRRVEGLTTYDIAYLPLGDDRALLVSMSYATEEPTFDETAFSALLDSIALP